MPVEVDVVEFADQQHMNVRFNHIGHILQCGERTGFSRDIHHQHARSRCFLQYFDRAADVGVMEFDAARRSVAEPIAQYRFGFGIGHEGEDVSSIRTDGSMFRSRIGECDFGRHLQRLYCVALPLAIGTTLAIALSGNTRTLSFLRRSNAAAAC